jgi:flagellar FliL protein
VVLLFACIFLLPNTARAESTRKAQQVLTRLDRYLQVMAWLQVASPEVVEMVKQYTPKIRHHITVLLSSKASDEVPSTQGKHDLIENIKHPLN